MLTAGAGNAARRDRAALAAERPEARLRAAGLARAARRSARAAAPSAACSPANLAGTAPHPRGRGARSFSRVSRCQRPRRDVQVRRPRGEERHRLRSVASCWRAPGARWRSLTEVTLKVLPRPETRGDAGAARPRRRGRGRGHGRRSASPSSVSGAAHLPAAAAQPVGPRRGGDGVAARRRRRRRSPRASRHCERELRRFGAASCSTTQLRARCGAPSATSRPSAAAMPARGRCGAFRPRPARAASSSARDLAGVDAAISTIGPAASSGWRSPAAPDGGAAQIRARVARSAATPR